MKSKVIQDKKDSEELKDPQVEEEDDDSEELNDPQIEEEEDDDSDDVHSGFDDSLEEDTDADDEDEDEEDEESKSGWADAMAKVLKSAKASEPSQVVLSKARKDGDVKSKISDKTTDEGEEPAPRTTKLKQSVIRSHKLAIESVGMQAPNVVRDKAKEKSLNKIATKGVVQLFNAVKKQQVDLKKDLNSVGKSIRKREKVYQSLDKNTFLENVLGAKASSGKKPKESVVAAKPVMDDEPMDIEEEVESQPKNWSVLRDDFMMGAKMKDWDKNSDSEG